MNKNEKLDELFEKWKKEKEITNFVDDGFTYPEVYEKQNLKILYILRDPHVVDTTKPASLREDLKNPEGEGKTWNNIGRWTMSLLDDAAYEIAEDINTKILAEQIARIGFMNLKKEAGSGQAKNIAEFSEKHRDHIKKQISICDPDIIVACGTFGELKNIVFERKWKRYPKICNDKYRVMPIEINGKEVQVIEFYHPQYSRKNEELFNDMRTIKECLINNINK